VKLYTKDTRRNIENKAMIVGIPAIVMALLFLFPEYTLTTTLSTFIVGFALIFMLLSKLGHYTVGGDGTEKQPLRKLIPRLLIAQISILIIMLGFRVATLTFIPWSDKLPPPQLLLETFRADLLLYALHPWGIIFLIAMGLGIVGAAVKNLKPAGIFEPIFGKSTRLRFGAGFDGACITGLLLGLFMLLTMATIIAMGYFAITFHLQQVAPTGLWALIGVFTCLLMARQWFRRYLTNSSVDEPRYGLLLVRMFCGLFIFSIFSVLLMNALPLNWQMILNHSVFINIVNGLSINQQWLLLVWAWPILFAPLLGRWFATELRGYSVRKSALLFFALPLALLGIVYALIHSAIPMAINQMPFLMAPGVITIVSLIAVMMVLIIFSKSESINQALVISTPNLLTGRSIRLKRLMIRTSNLSGFIFIAMMVTGISSLFMMTLAFAIPMMGFWLLSLAVFVKCAFKKTIVLNEVRNGGTN
jgi:hypothetical protein